MVRHSNAGSRSAFGSSFPARSLRGQVAAGSVITPEGAEIIGYPMITIADTALDDIWAYIELHPVEIAGLGYVEALGNGRFHVSEVFLVRQAGTAANVDITEGTLEWLNEQSALNTPEADQRIARARFWWHSHVDMPAQWSGTDNNTADILGFNPLIALVGNRREDYTLRFDLYEPVRMTFDRLTLNSSRRPQLTPEVRRRAREQMDRFVQRGFGTWFTGGGRRAYEDEETRRPVGTVHPAYVEPMGVPEGDSGAPLHAAPYIPPPPPYGAQPAVPPASPVPAASAVPAANPVPAANVGRPPAQPAGGQQQVGAVRRKAVRPVNVTEAVIDLDASESAQL